LAQISLGIEKTKLQY